MTTTSVLGPVWPAPMGEILSRPSHSPPQAGVDLCSHVDLVWRLLRRLGVPRELADDAAQEVFVIATSKLGQIRPGKERAFLFGVSLNVAARFRRARARRREVSDEQELEHQQAPGIQPDDAVELRRIGRLLDQVMSEMPEKLRIVFALFEIEQMSAPEIAEILSVPQGTVASRLRLARKAFHKGVQRANQRHSRRRK